jgi:zinc transporter ZupT
MSILPAISGILALVLLLPLLGGTLGIGAFIIIVVANRADPDPTGKRPMAVYLFAGSFLTLWVAYVGAVVIVASLVNLIGTNTYFGYTSELHPFGDAAVRGATIGALILIIAGGLHELHRRRGLELAESEDDPTSPTKRVARSYVSVVSFISIFLMLILSIGILYDLFGIIAPSIYHFGDRVTTLKGLLDILFAFTLAAVIFSSHQQLAPNPLRLFRARPAAIVVDVVDVVVETPSDQQ